MYPSIVVPLDGSPLSESCLPLALSVARRHGAGLKLVHVHVVMAGVYGESVLTYDEMLDRVTRENKIAYLQSIVERLKDAEVPVTTALLDGIKAPVAEAVCQYAQAETAGLVVMTTHGRGLMARLWLGSVADSLIRQSPLPVLLVRPREASRDPNVQAELRHVLLPLDGSEFAEQVVEPVLEFGAGMQSEYTLLQVIKPLLPISSGVTDFTGGGADGTLVERLHKLQQEIEVEAQNYLEGVAKRFRSRSLHVKTKLVFHDRPAVAIHDAVDQHTIDLVALATHGRGGISRMFLGSVADKVLRGSTVPLFVVRPVEKTQPKGPTKS